MTISSTYAPVQYIGNGVTTTFSFPYVFYDDTDIIVTLTLISTGEDTVQVNPTNYSLTGGDGDVGNVVFVSAPSSSYRITIERSIPYEQGDNYVENQAFPANTIETAFDKAVVRDQQLAASIDASLKFPATLSGSLVGVLPQPEDGKLLIWDGTAGTVGNATFAEISTSIDTVLTSLASTDILVWNGSAFVNQTIGETLTATGILKRSGTTISAATAGTDYYAPGGTGVAVLDGGTGLSIALVGHINGYQMSTAGSSTTMTIGSGTATDNGNAAYLYLSASINKTTSAWAVGTGNGGIDTGTIANSTWYHFYAIRRPDTGVVDVIFSLSASSPTLPTNYTQYRRIGSALTNGSAQWVKFIQYGDKFIWDTSSLDIDVTNPGSSAVTRTLTVPTGVIVTAIGEAYILNSASSDSLLISQLSITDSAASNTAWPLCTAASNGAGGVDVGYFECETNASAQVRSRMRIGTATTNLRIATTGWIDNRGKL